MPEKYTKWYRVGTVDVTNGSKYVTGTSCYWLATTFLPGDFFTTDNGQSFYEIDEVVDSSHITLKTIYTGETKQGISYAISRNFTASDSSKIAAVTAELVNDFVQYIDNDMQTIHGQSAYEIAVKEGYTGTESEWLESLKAAGEWSKANESITALETDNTTNKETLASHTEAITTLQGYNSIWVNYGVAAHRCGTRGGFHNSICRGRSLGSSITAEQFTAIHNQSFTDMFIGDYWTINGHNYTIAAFNRRQQQTKSDTDWGDIVLVTGEQDLNHPINKTNTTEGGWASSAFYNDEDGGYAIMKERILKDIPQEHILDTTVDAGVKNPNSNMGTWAFQISTAVDEQGNITGVKNLPGLQIAPLTVQNIVGNSFCAGKTTCSHAWSRDLQLPYYFYSGLRAYSLGGNPWNDFFLDSYQAGTGAILGVSTNASCYPVAANSTSYGWTCQICIV